jgi:hypothetical protein
VPLIGEVQTILRQSDGNVDPLPAHKSYHVPSVVFIHQTLLGSAPTHLGEEEVGPLYSRDFPSFAVRNAGYLSDVHGLRHYLLRLPK